MHDAWQKINDELVLISNIVTNDTDIEIGFCEDSNLDRKIWVYNKPNTAWMGFLWYGDM